jgi:multicomponent Na+:H+ antiporter subunit E
VLSGKFDLIHFGTGVLATLAIAATIHPVDDGTRTRWGRMLTFIPWLLWQIVLSNLRVARLVLHPDCPVRPALLDLDPPVPTPRARALLGIAVTLTPGTLTVDVDDKGMQVHALDEGAAEGLTDGPMVRRVCDLFTPKAS